MRSSSASAVPNSESTSEVGAGDEDADWACDATAAGADGGGDATRTAPSTAAARMIVLNMAVLRLLLFQPLRNLEHLSRLDLVGVRQLIAVRVEDRRVRVGVAQELLRNLAERVAGLHGVGLRLRLLRGAPARLDVGDDLRVPVRNRLDRVPNLVRLVLRLHRALDKQLAVALLGRPVEVKSFCRFHGVLVLSGQQSHAASSCAAVFCNAAATLSSSPKSETAAEFS